MALDGAKEEPRETLVRLMKEVAYSKEEVDGDKPPADALKIEVVDGSVMFRPGKLEAARPQFIDLIREVVGEHFFKDHSGGCSIALLTLDANGQPWATPIDVELLVAAAIGLGLAHWVMPRELWQTLPGGLPYVSFENLPAEHKRPRKTHPQAAKHAGGAQ